jgi:hypothetical protein
MLFQDSALTEKSEMKFLQEKENDFKGNNFKDIVLRNLSETSFHGVYSIYYAKDFFLKFILVACFLASSGFLCILTAKTFIDFLSYSVLSSNTLIAEIPTECNFQFLNTFKGNYM